MMDAGQQAALFANTARAIGGATAPVQDRHVANCARADPAYGAGIREALERLQRPRPN
jgi:catalase